MKNKIFDRKLYLESLRRTSVIGGLFTVLLTVASLLVFFAYTLDLDGIDPRYVDIQVLNFYEINPMLLAIAYTLCPLLCLNLFGFLNKRSTSDFWHSVPFTRTCLYNTFSLAVLTWSFISVAVSGAVSIICFSTVPSFYAINWGSVLSTVLALLASQVLVVAGVNIALSTTGSYFSNIVVSGLILFLPRLLLLFFAYASSNSHLFVISLKSSWLSPAHNLVAGMIFSMGDIPEMLSSYGSTIYTAVLGIIYYFLGMLLFAKRKSESAGKSAVNKHMQSAFRIIVCFTVCLVPIYLITAELNRNKQIFQKGDWFTILVLYIVALAAYFIYELITTKKLKNLVAAAPALVIVALLNFITIGGAHIAYRVEYDYTPTPLSVSEITLGNPEDNSRDYFETAISNLVIEDNEIEQLLCNSYVNTRKAYETGGIHHNAYTSLVVGFKTNGIYHYRYVYINEEDHSKLTNLLYKNKSFEEIFDIEKIAKKEMGGTYSVHLPFSYPDNEKQNEELREKLMKAYIDDIKGLDFEKWFAIATNTGYDNVEWINENGETKYSYIATTLDGSIPIGGKNTYFSLPICNLTPKAYAIVMETVADHQESNNAQQILIEALKNDNFGFDNEDGKYYHNISVELYNGIRMTRSEYYNIQDYERLSKLIEILEPVYGQVPSANSRIAIVNYSYQLSEKDETYQFYTAVFKIPDEADLTFLLEQNLTGGEIPNADIVINSYDPILVSSF